jgi:microcystin-dependent protein
MPRDGSDIYHIPPGTLGIPDTTIESNKYNAFVLDIQQEANTPRPIVAGGTGSSNPDAALASLSGEKASQIVTNFDSYVWVSGSFSSAISAISAPVALHAFSGIAYVTDGNNAVVEARDMTDVNNVLYVRVKTAGVWSAWVTDNASQYVKKAGDTMTGPLLLSGDPTVLMGAATKQYVDAGVQTTLIIDTVAPPNARDNSLWWESDSGLLYIRYNDGDTTQWVLACPQPDITAFVQVTGDTMEGMLTLHSDPVNPLDAATKQYVDSRDVRPGTIRFTICATADVGWRMFDDGTIGDSSSGATFSNATSVNVFTLMYNNFADAQAPLLSSAGTVITRASMTNAATAWAAHCRMSLPKTLGRAMGVAGSGAGLTARPLGAVAGEETHTPTQAEMFSHYHTGSTGTDSPDHAHNYNMAASSGAQKPASGGTAPFDTYTGPVTGGANVRHLHTISADGSSAPHNVMSPISFLNAEIKL